MAEGGGFSFGSCFCSGHFGYQTVVVVEAVVHGTDGIGIDMTVRILHNDAYKGVIILFGISNKGIFGFRCIACFAADAGIIMVFGIHQHLMLVIECKAFRSEIGRFDSVFLTSGDFAKCGILNRLLCNKCHIMGTGIMLRVVESVWVDEMCVGAAKLFGPFIHQIAESTDRTAEILGSSVADFIG